MESVGDEQNRRHPARRHGPADAAAVDDAAHDVELHRDEVLRLVFLTQVGLVHLDEAALRHVRQAEEHDACPGLGEVEARHGFPADRDQGRDDDAAEVLSPGEAFVGAVLVHAPGGRVGAREQPDGESDGEVHAILLSVPA
jgi:hypothetical protein